MRVYLENTENYYNNLPQRYNLIPHKDNYYNEQIRNLYRFLIPRDQNILEIGCGTGELLASLHPKKGVGIDISENVLKIAKKKFPKLTFEKGNEENIQIKGSFDYIILSDLVGILNDIQQAFLELHKITNNESRIIVSYHNYLWEPLLVFMAKIGLKTTRPTQSWLSHRDVENLLEISDLDIIKGGTFLLIPFYIPIISHLTNKYIARLPIIRNLCLVRYFVARKKSLSNNNKDYSVSIVLPARNEEGNIEDAVKKIPKLGKKMEIIFVEDHSKDNTKKEIERVSKIYKNNKEIILLVQNDDHGKAAAVKKGFEKASGDILIVFDSDLTTDPKDLPKFYNALKNGKGDLIQGSRMIYPIEKDAMRFLNIIANKFFGVAFSFLLDQRIKDTLCGTKVLFRKDYQKIVKNSSYFGNFDPFGDFDLIFGSSKLNLKIIEIPIRYKARQYGRSNINRFRHGWLLFKMTIFAARKIKFF